ncbi:phosphopentomutase [Halanaerobiaceae bacterium Z-7014]|uniref:Phosphopentomutase n=1 Tax=Halonatronomonas betaini TaxID=2778430 RepID=A0A931FAE9_9FIRM|nr:phosphopentomutase [Halonatronomonas betaini]MBF8437534.1 phosphopentomutase [Halonatronomonas betaini]
MTDIKRTIMIVLDSVGIGELPDAEEYGDIGADTLGNIAEAVGGLDLPNLEQLGLGKIRELKGMDSNIEARGIYGKMAEASKGKDTTTGHWELAGLVSNTPFPKYPDGFPDEVIDPFLEKTGFDGILGNKPASGTVIIEELIDEHLETGNPIVYTSADSVFQIAAHEDVIPIKRLYEICEIARDILTGEHGVARVIARPFIGEPGSLERTDRRKDFSLVPPKPTLLNLLEDAGQDVIGVGKIIDIFAGSGVTESDHVIDNMKGVDSTIDYMGKVEEGLIFTNLVETDMIYGHRRDVDGYYQALKDFDKRLPEILSALKPTDLLVITADHGCDPTYEGTDHTREYVPLLLVGQNLKKDKKLETRDSFADLAATLAELHKVEPTFDGISFVEEIIN